MKSADSKNKWKINSARWTLIILTTLMASSILGVFFYGLAPKSLPIIKPTYFDEKQEIGAVIFRRLFQEMKPSRGILLETDPSIEGGEQIWLGFVKVAAQYGKKFDLIIQHEELKNMFTHTIRSASGPTQIGLTREIHKSSPFIQVNFRENKKEFREVVQKNFSFGKTILIHGPIDTQLPPLRESNSEKLKAHFIRITQQTFVTQPSEEGPLIQNCPDEKDTTTHRSCQALHLSRKYYRKNLQKERLLAALEKFKDRRFTLFVHEPSNLNSSHRQDLSLENYE